MNIQPMTLEVSAPRMSQSQSMQKTNAKKNDDPFASVLSKTQDRQEYQKKHRVTRDNTKSTSKSNSTRESIQADKKEPSKPVSITEVDNLEESISKERTKVEAAAMEAVANLLQITPGELEQLLGVLQIGLADLLQGDKLQQLLMQVHNVDEPMDLLLIPEVVTEMKAVTSILEEPGANSLINTFSEGQSGQELEIVADKNILGVNASNNLQKSTKDDMDSKAEGLDQDNNTMGITGTSTGKISTAAGNDENLLQNEEGSTPNKNPSNNEFLETLTQSLGTAFQGKSEQVKDATLGRYEAVNPRMVLDQIVERIKISALNEEAQMTIHLKPEHLGKLTMEVISKQGVMTAMFTVENEKTKAMLEQNIQNLKDTLEDKGLVIQQLEVTVGQNQQEDRQTYKNAKSNRDVSTVINRIMNENISEEVDLEKTDKNETSEVNFTA